MHVAMVNGQDKILDVLICFYGIHLEPYRLFKLDLPIMALVAAIVRQSPDNGASLSQSARIFAKALIYLTQPTSSISFSIRRDVGEKGCG
jgi:hypothetical protein